MQMHPFYYKFPAAFHLQFLPMPIMETSFYIAEAYWLTPLHLAVKQVSTSSLIR